MKIKGKNETYSLIKVLRSEGRLSDETEIAINSLSLEELLSVKLELAAGHFNSKMFGIPIWYSLKNVVQDALLKFALSSTKTKREAARLLGLLPADFRHLLKKYETESFFEKK
tara:strand:+ start:1586 stop:1924 length:339 start_codon:yes stop_codon:yes gene_type:complete